MNQIKIQKSITNRDSESVDRYLREIGKTDLLTADEEVELARRIRRGDMSAANKLVESNLRFVVSVANQYKHQGLHLADLIQQGNLGLIKAAKKFDETRGFKFISYAVWYVRQSIQQALDEQSRIIRQPLNFVGLTRKVLKEMAAFEQENLRRPSIEELADILDLPEEKVSQALSAYGRHSSIDAPFAEGEENSLLDVLTNDDSPLADDGMMAESLSTDINRALSDLNERERRILQLSYGIGCQEMSLDEIGEKFGLTRERVRQIREKGIRHLRKQHGSLLKHYLAS